MTQRERTSRIRTAAVGVSATLLGVTAPVTASATGESPPGALTWSVCAGTGLDPRQECATLDVPMDHGALKLRKAFGGRAVMVTVNSSGHDAYLANGNACGDRTVSRFLATGVRPARDVYCR